MERAGPTQCLTNELLGPNTYSQKSMDRLKGGKKRLGVNRLLGITPTYIQKMERTGNWKNIAKGGLFKERELRGTLKDRHELKVLRKREKRVQLGRWEKRDGTCPDGGVNQT